MRRPIRSATARYGSCLQRKSFGSGREKRALTLSDLRASKPVRLADGAQAARQRAVDIDRALADLAARTFGPNPDVSLVAVGGYGRGELSPFSDIDLLFLVRPRSELSPATLRGLLYPLWDAGWQVGHALRTAKEAVERATQDLDAATAALSARLIAGNDDHFLEFKDRFARWVAKQQRSLIRRIADATKHRHETAERGGWVLAPDLKNDIGTMRDVHRLGWLRAIVGAGEIPDHIGRPYDILLAAREALHGEVNRKLDRLRIDLQPRVARRLGFDADDGRDELMMQIHSAARSIEFESATLSEEIAAPVVGGPRRSGSVTHLSSGLRIEDGVIVAMPENEPTPAAGMAVIEAVSMTGRPCSARTVAWLHGCFARELPPEWDRETRASFVAAVAGEYVTEALELMDHVGGWRLIPEWSRIRGRAQHDPYHRYTVDGHLFITVAEVERALHEDALAATAAAQAGDLVALRMGALLHDIGKGSGTDHSVVGHELATAVCQRIGFAPETTNEIAQLVRWHLLLVDTATRRDLDDGAVIAQVAETIGDGRILRLLYVLTVADANATGPEAWSEWKAALVGELFRKALVALETGELPARSDVVEKAREVEAYEPSLAGRAEELLATLPPSYMESTAVEDIADELRMLLQPPQPGQVKCRIYEGVDESAITVCLPDRPGTLARTAGVLALNRVSVRSARAFVTTTGIAIERFTVVSPGAEAFDAVRRDLEAVYAGKLALEARLDRKIADYAVGTSVDPRVTVLQDASAHSTVIEVRSADVLGLLYAVTAAMSELDLDIHVAKIDTLGERVVDVFYVRTSWGSKLGDDQAGEVERAIEHRVARLFKR
ncbi:MAG: [protein-PII] uridylyltransferase [Actinobacteria bacterium]|nr:[protein-PII] uridylyltransferase [Actinomycetota bacterium]